LAIVVDMVVAPDGSITSQSARQAAAFGADRWFADVGVLNDSSENQMDKGWALKTARRGNSAGEFQLSWPGSVEAPASVSRAAEIPAPSLIPTSSMFSSSTVSPSTAGNQIAPERAYER